MEKQCSANQEQDQSRAIGDLMNYHAERLCTPLLSFGVWLQKDLKYFFNQPLLKLLPFVRPKVGDIYVGWGRKRSGRRAEIQAKNNSSSYYLLEDGFLRSFGVGEFFPPLSVIVDSHGIYYDCNCASTLENLLSSGADVLHGINDDVTLARQMILQNRLSKYNHAPNLRDGLLRKDERERVLVVDQTAGDMSVSLGGADSSTFSAMLEAALAENPKATIYVKTHPVVSSRRKVGYLTGIREDSRVVLLRDPVNPLSLIEQMDRVYVVTSTMGFEALLAGKRVTCFGIPWYSGWGVTDDRQACPRRVRRRTVDELFAAAYFHYSRYLNPVTHQLGTIFDVIEWLIRQRWMASVGFHDSRICERFHEHGAK